MPYRYLKEPIDNFDKNNQKIWKTLLTGTDLNHTKKVITILSSYFDRIDRLSSGKSKLNYNGDLGFYNILKWSKLNCNQQSVIATHILNDIGIPTYIDFTPMWLNRDSGHSWCVSKDTTGVYLPFSPWWQSVNEKYRKGVFSKNYFKRTSKVYRRTYEIQKEHALKYSKKNEDIPPFFRDKHFLDVTDAYHKTTTLTIPIQVSNFKNNNLAYLSIFKRNGWHPIAWAKVDRQKEQIVFEKVPVGIVYTLGTYTDKKITSIDDAFYVDNKGNTKTIKPSKGNKIKVMRLFEKYPEKERLLDYRAERIGGVFEGANNNKFKNADTLYTFTKRPEGYVKEIKINTNKKYRYVRFIHKNIKQSGIAISEFLKKTNVTDSIIKAVKPYVFNYKGIINDKYLTKLTGKLISNNKKATFKRLNRATDGNLETYVNDKWVGVDFGKPEKIYSIRYAFRNANNKINLGDTYELYYYENGWQYFNSKKAKYNFLDFKKVPSNTMYWLKNITKGKEELPFFYIDDKQVFVNYDNDIKPNKLVK